MSDSSKGTFVSLCLAGRAKVGDIDDYVELWHQGSSDLPLHEFLGLTREEYGAWVQDSGKLRQLLVARRRKSRMTLSYKIGEKKRPKSAAEKGSEFSALERRRVARSPLRRTIKEKAN